MCRFGGGGAVFAGVGGAVVDAGGEVALDGLAAADELGVIAAKIDLMAAGGESFADGGGHAVFDGNVTAIEAVLHKTGRFHRFLNIHSVIDDVGNELGVSLGLIESAHNAEGDASVAVGEEAGNDGMEGALAAGEGVGGSGIENEKAATILKDEASAVGDDAGAESSVVGLNEGNHVAVFIDGGEVGRVTAGGKGGLAGIDVAIRFLGVDKFGALRGVGFVEQAGDGNFGEARIADVAAKVSVGEFFRFDGDVVGIGGARAGISFRRSGVLAEREIFHDVEHFESGDALAIGGNFGDGPAAVVD